MMFLPVPVKCILLSTCLSALVCTFLTFYLVRSPVAAQAHAGSYPVQRLTNISYGPYPDEVLDLCLPDGAPPLRPGIIMIHGGGWSGGDKSNYERMCNDYAAEGFVVTSINYRLAPRYQWPDQIGDVQLAVRYMRVIASRTELNPTRICALGDSAGAHLALLLDELQAIHAADVANLYANISPSVGCVVDQFGPTALAQLYKQNPSVRQTISNLLDYQTPPAPIYQDASPIDHIDSQTGQALIIQGTLDQTVLPEQSRELRKALQQIGIPVQYISYDGGHEYKGLSLGQIANILAQVNTFLLSVEQPQVP